MTHETATIVLPETLAPFLVLTAPPLPSLFPTIQEERPRRLSKSKVQRKPVKGDHAYFSSTAHGSSARDGAAVAPGSSPAGTAATEAGDAAPLGERAAASMSPPLLQFNTNRGGGSPHERSDTYEDRIRRLSPGRTKQRRPSRLSIGSTSASSSPRSTDDYTAADFAKQKKELLVGSGRLLRPTIELSIELISGHPLGSPLTPFDRHVGSHSRRRSRTGSDNSPYLVGSPKSG